MKKKYKYLAIAATVLSMASCDLDMMPETTMTDAAFWKTENDLRGACNRFYQQMTGSLGGFSHDYRSDELRGNSANSTSDGSWTVPSTSGNWTDPYWRIFISNNIIEKAERAAVTEEVRNKYLAEARFFRAFHFFELVKKYGDVPMIMKAVSDTQDPVLEMPRTSREEVIQQCYEDLDFATEWLPDIDHVDTWGHVSRSAALAMLVRIGLYEGTYIKYHNLQEGDYRAHLKKAIDAAETMMHVDRKHGLYPDFQALFTYDGEGRQNPENVFVRVFGPNEAPVNTNNQTHGNSREMENTVTVTRNMVDLFLYTDGLPREKSPLKVSPETCFDDVFLNRDPRLSMTVYKKGDDAYKGAYIPFSFRNGYNLKKGFIMKDWTNLYAEAVDKMVIRYAEVLISYAEALYEYNGNITDAQLDETVNALRSRVGMPTMLTNAFATANGLDMLQEIRRERTVEFIDENKRYDDIIRWKIAEDVLPTYLLGARLSANDVESGKVDELKNRITLNGGMFNGKKVCDEDSIYILEIAEDRRFDPGKDYLYPVPLQEITLSGNNVTQNPGWN